MNEEDPVHITGSVHVASMPKTTLKKYLKTQPRTFILPPGDPNGPQLIRPETSKIHRTILVPSLAPGSQTGSVTASSEQTPGNPAVASNYVYTNTSGVPQQVSTVHAFFTTDATVLNRFIQVTVRDAANNVLWQAIDGTAVVASSTIAFNGYVGAQQQNTSAGTFTFPIPGNDGAIPPGGTLTIGSGAFGAGDQISNIAFTLLTTIVTGVAYAWVGSGEGEVGEQKACLIRSDIDLPIELEGQTALWAFADPASPLPLYLSVWLEVETEPR